MEGEEPERQEAQDQVRAALEAIQGTVLRLLQEGETHPQLMVLTAASWPPRPRSRAGGTSGRPSARSPKSWSGAAATTTRCSGPSSCRSPGMLDHGDTAGPFRTASS